MVKNLAAMKETWLQFLGHEDPLRGGYGNPLEYSCLDNPIDRGAWRAKSTGSQRVRHDLATKHVHTEYLNLFTSLSSPK